MNYILQLRSEVAALQAQLAALEAGLDDFRIFVLTNPKFGARPLHDADGLPLPEPGERLDWIATGDVARRLTAIRDAGREAAENLGAAS
jgi:hypothetical protein